MKGLRLVLRFFGWLLTPIVAWAASFFGGAAAAWLTRGLPSSTALWLTLLGGAVGALLAILGWLRLLRRSPRLQHALEVSEDGTPLAALDLGGGER